MKPKFGLGDTIYYIENGVVRQGVVRGVVLDTMFYYALEGIHCYGDCDERSNPLYEDKVFNTREECISHAVEEFRDKLQNK